MKSNYIVDTMAIVLWMENRKVPVLVKEIFESADENQIKIFIPAIVVAEIGYLSERKRIEIGLKNILRLCIENENYEVLPLTYDIVSSAFEIKDVPELHDRLISGTGRQTGFEIITNDIVIRKSKYVKAVW